MNRIARHLNVFALTLLSATAARAAGGGDPHPVAPSTLPALPPPGTPPLSGGGGGFVPRVVNTRYVDVNWKLEPAAFAGVSTVPVTAPLGEQLRLPRGVGLVVDFVEPKGPADVAGLKRYDVLHKLDDQLLVNAHQFAVLVRTHKAGDEVTLTVVRQGEPRPVKVKLAERDAEPLDAQNPWGSPPMAIQWAGPPPLRAADGRAETRGVRGETRMIDQNGDVTTLQSVDGGQVLIITDKDGREMKTLILDGGAGLKDLPPDVQQRYRQLQKMLPKVPGMGPVPFQPLPSPATRPASSSPLQPAREERGPRP